MKLKRLWQIVTGHDELLDIARKEHAQAREDLHMSTQRLDAVTEEVTARTIRITRGDKKSEQALNELNEVAKHG